MKKEFMELNAQELMNVNGGAVITGTAALAFVGSLLIGAMIGAWADKDHSKNFEEGRQKAREFWGTN